MASNHKAVRSYASNTSLKHGVQFDPYIREHYGNGKTESDARTFHYFAVGAGGAVAFELGKGIVMPFIMSMGAAADVLALANTEFDLATVPEGAAVVIKWRGKPLFIRHRTQEEIAQANETPMSELRDPQTDASRVRGDPKYLVLLGVCTHLGCVPVSHAGNYHGWFCPCHGSHYDTSGRIRQGPAPLNLAVPPYKYMDDTHIVVGLED